MTFRIGFLLFTILVGTIGCKTSQVDDKSDYLKLMTYNIRIGKGGGEWNDDPAQIELKPVARLIGPEGPDIVGLQEVDRFRKRTSLMDQPATLSLWLRQHVAFQAAYTVPVPGGNNEEYGNALLTRFPIKNSERIPLFKPDYSKTNPNYPDYYSEQRSLLHGEVLIRGKTVHVFVTHLGLTADQRAQQVQQILQAAAQYKGPKIIMGDFNAEPDEPAMQLLARQYTDVLSAVNTASEDRKSYPAGTAPKTAIDYIFVSKHFEVINAKVIRNESLASDHNPVVAEVRLAR